MTRLSATIAKLAAMRGMSATPGDGGRASHLRDLENFGSNPGTLKGKIHRQDIAGHRYRVWTDASGHPIIEDYRIANMGHGTPLATTGDEACGVAMPHMLEAGISSTRRIAASWGLLGAGLKPGCAQPRTHLQAETSTWPAARISRLEPLPSTLSSGMNPARGGVEKVIHDALRSAGLMR